jgi:predicted cupin superfamily sugar epimerase
VKDRIAARAAALVSTLGLTPHPEGGFYAEVYRSAAMVQPEDGRGSRHALTTIYFLLIEGTVSRWHLVRSDEIWHFYEGDPLDLWIADPGARQINHHRLGPLDGAQRPVVTVPSGHWQAARPTGSHTLVGCTVGPGFDFRDFNLAGDEDDIATLLHQDFPDLAALL